MTKHSLGYVWWVERNKLGVATTDNGSNFTSPTTNDHEMRIWASKLGDHFTIGAGINTAEESELPAMFHEGLIAKVNESVYEKNPETLGLAQYWRNKYDDFIIEAKRYANTRVKGYNLKGEEF
jgi:hypothetical protein